MAAESDAPEFAAIEDWRSWRPSTTFSPTVRFGQMRIDLRSDEASESLPMPEPYDVPALLAFPQHANLLLKHEPAGRAAAIDTLRLVMLRLLTALPPGRVQFTLIDPVSLGESFAGFMHLADDDDALVGGRVWTDADQIDRQLTDLTEHMETVIQKYLRNAFATIDDYNEQAGELAEPYRFLVIADLPTNFSEASLRRLSSIMSSGPRCGVHVVAALDVRQPWQASTTLLEDLENGSTTLLFDDEEQHFVWDDDVFGRFPLTLDSPPDDAQLTDVLRVIGKAAKDAKRVEVPFTTITPETLWTGNSAQDISVPVGRSGATRIQQFRFGRGVAQHALIAGKTGSGKSTLLNALICNLALHYPPDQLALYLIDFKRGVEFKTYATHKLPHARAVAVESDREFGLSVLQRLDEEIARRGDLFRDAGVQDLAAFRAAKPDVEMPRVLLVVDEFQELFSDDDKLAQDAALLIDRLVRQGRAFGMHVVLGSQTIAGGAGLARSTLGQIAIRVALQTTENDSRLILGEDNTAARLLTRPGEAIYNDAGGAIEGNSPFQVAWLPDAERDTILQRVTDRATDEPERELAIFEGNAPADLADNLELKTDAVRQSVAYLGEAVAIRPPTHFPFRRQVGSHLLMVGQQDESVTALVASSVVSLHHTSNGARLLVCDGTPTDAALHGLIRNVASTVGADAEFADYRALPDVLADAARAVRDRADGDTAPPLFVIIHQLQRFRDLAKHDEFGSSSAFSSMLGDDQPAQADPPGKLLLEILRDGPPVGVHVIATVDTYASLERRLGREALREFDGRVLFQMSANDSS
ncbi:MAG: FtsK/SpoIIIE domain-containing protein, partial [Planctomycetota bacterium]